MVRGSSPQLFPKLITPSSVANGDATFPHSPSSFNSPIPTVSPLELVLSRPICFELSAVAFKVQACCNCRKSVVRKTLPAALVHTSYRTLIIVFLTVLLLSFYANLFLALQSARCSVAQLLLGICEVLWLLHPS